MIYWMFEILAEGITSSMTTAPNSTTMPSVGKVIRCPVILGKSFQFFIADFDRYTTEISIMEADSPISVNATYDAIDWALGRNATKIVSIENMEISGFRAAFVESQWEDGYLYVAVVPVGQTAKITVAKIGDRKSAMYVINKMKIWK